MNHMNIIIIMALCAGMFLAPGFAEAGILALNDNGEKKTERKEEQEQMQERLADIHKQKLREADARVAEARDKAEQDPLRPVFHLMTPANWINDPNGPVYFEGRYHMFFQHNPWGDQWGNMSWGHAVSGDLVHWEHWPIALTPNPELYDAEGVFSGCCVINNGVPVILYTGVQPEVQCIATSEDGMRTWTKHPANPVIGKRPRDDLQGFRDPFVWKEEDGWYMVIGSGINGEGGTALLYRSPDLIGWEYLHPLCTGFAKNWECPNFFPLGDKHVLVVSPHGPVQYAAGEYADRRFTPGRWHEMDYGNYYAPNCLEAPDGRRIMWGWIRQGGTKGYPWNGCLTLPRELILLEDGRIGQAPARELTALRGRHYTFENITVAPERKYILPDVASNTCEIHAKIAPGNGDAVGIEVLRTANGKEKFTIRYDNIRQRIEAGASSGGFQLRHGEALLDLRIFVDRSVVEVYANGRACITERVYPDKQDALGIAIFSRGMPARVKRVDVWELGSIW
jgi:beta-fructofuranosidase